MGIISVLGLTTNAHAAGLPTNWQKGIQVQPMSSTDFSSESFKQSMRNAKATGVNHVKLVIPLRQSNIYSSDLSQYDGTPSDQSLRDGADYIHSLDMAVSFSIHANSNDGKWRALINPNDRTTWFNNYSRLLNHYGDIAQATRTEELLIGTEMSSTTIPSFNSQNTPGWIRMIQSVRGHYSGSLIYGAQRSDYMGDDQVLEFWSYLDVIGISAYYSMGDASSSVDAMKSRWSQIDTNQLRGLSARYNKPLTFTEVGYVSGNNGLGDPGTGYENPGGVNQGLQARAYEALFSYWATSNYMRGVALWDWSSNPNAGGQYDTGYTPQNKQAQEVMKTWFTAPSTGTTPPPTQTPSAYTIKGSAATGTAGNSTTSTVSFASSNPVQGSIVDIEVYDATGQRVAQKFYENESLSSTAKDYTITWTPLRDGVYTIKAGVFTSNWQSNLVWSDTAGTTTVAVTPTTPPPVVTPPVTQPPVTQPPATTPPPVTPPTTTPTTPPLNSKVNIWWPSNGSTVSGVQPFKALIDGVDQNSYQLFWQVDGGQLNLMPTVNDGVSHKETLVDLTGWNWQSTGRYTLTFVAKSPSGTVLGQQSTTITITR